MQGTVMPLQDVQPITYTGTILQFTTALLLALVFLVVRRYARRHSYVAPWSWAWCALALAIGAIVTRYNILPSVSAPLSDDRQPPVRWSASCVRPARSGMQPTSTSTSRCRYPWSSLPAAYVPSCYFDCHRRAGHRAPW